MRGGFLILLALLALDARAEALRVAAAAPAVSPAFVEVRGTVRPVRSLVKRLLPGQEVLQVAVRTGARVPRGAPLVYLDDAGIAARISSIESQRMELDLLRMEVAQVREQQQRLKERAAREEELTRRLTPTAPNGTESGAGLREVNNRLQILEHKLEMMTAAQRSLWGEGAPRDPVAVLRERLVIRAPFDGTVARAADHLYGLAAGDTVLELWDDSELVVEADVWQQQVTRIEKGARAEVVANGGDTPVEGVVKEIGTARSDGRADGFPIYPATIAFRVPVAGTLLPGMAVTVRIYGH